MPDESETPHLDALLARVRAVCQAKGHGALGELASVVNRTPSQVGEYLTPNARKTKRRPNAEIALAMQAWVEQNEK